MQMTRLMLNTLNRVADFLESKQGSFSPDITKETLEKIKLECDYIFKWLMTTHPIPSDANTHSRSAIARKMLHDACVLFKANIYDRLVYFQTEYRVHWFSAFLRWVWLGSEIHLASEDLVDYIPREYSRISSNRDDLTVFGVSTADEFIAYVKQHT